MVPPPYLQGHTYHLGLEAESQMVHDVNTALEEQTWQETQRLLKQQLSNGTSKAVGGHELGYWGHSCPCRGPQVWSPVCLAGQGLFWKAFPDSLPRMALS